MQTQIHWAHKKSYVISEQGDAVISTTPAQLFPVTM